MELDWDELISTLLSTRADREYFFDRESGDIIALAELDEGEEPDDEEEIELRELLEDEPDRFVEIVPVDPSDRTEWMENFIASLKDDRKSDLGALLLKALHAPSPLREFEKVLSHAPEEKAHWISFQEGQAQEALAAWIEENDVEYENPPPWKGGKSRRRAPPKS